MATAKNIFSERDFPALCFPNWFEREHGDLFAGRTLTDAEWEWLVDHADCLADAVSELFRDYVRDYVDKQADADEQRERLEGV